MSATDGYSMERRAERQKVDFRIQLVYYKDGTRQSVHGRGSDASEGGMAVYAAAEVEEGQHVSVEFTIPYSRKELIIEAVVRNKQGYRYGLEFLALSSTQRGDLKKLCQTASIMNSV